MDNLPDDIYKIILGFISVRERESTKVSLINNEKEY